MNRSWVDFPAAGLLCRGGGGVVVGRGGQRQVAAATTCGPEFALPVGRCWCCAGSWLVSPGQPRGEEQPWQ